MFLNIIHKIIYKSIFILFIINAFSISPENIDGPANIRDKPNGKILYQLLDSVEIFPYLFDDNWLKIEFSACVKKNDYNEKSLFIMPNSILYSCRNNKEIGKTFEKINADYLTLYNDKYITYIKLGVTHRNNIKGKLLISESLEKLILNKSSNLNHFLSHIEIYKYEKRILKKGIYTIYYAEGNYVGDESPPPRVILLFKKETLISLAIHQNISPKIFKDHLDNKGYNAKFYKIYHASNNKDEKSEVTKILKDFLGN